MALDKTGLKAALEACFTPPELGGTLPDNDSGDAADHISACAQRWSDAMQIYVAGMQPQHLAAAVGTASSNLGVALEGVFSGWYESGNYDYSQLNAAFDAFASEIALSVGVETSGRTEGIPLEGVFSGWYESGNYDYSQLNAAFDAFASEIALSVGVETSGRTEGIPRVFIGTPPPGINLCSLSTLDENEEDPYGTAAQNFADLIDDWFTQGVSDTTDDSLPTKPHLTLPWI